MRIFSIVFTIFLFLGCINSKPRQPVILKNQENLHGCDFGRLSSRLTQGPDGKVVEELRLRINCKKSNSRVTGENISQISDYYGRHWKIDKEGNLVVPAKLSPEIFYPPAIETWKIDSLLASRLYSQRYYQKAMRQLLSILQLPLPSKQKSIVNKYFCRIWTKLKQKGGSWSKLLKTVAGGSWKQGNQFRFFNYAFDYIFDYPLNYRIVVKKFPVKNKGDIVLVSLKSKIPENKKDVVLLFSTDDPEVKLEKFFNLGDEGWINKGDKQIQKKDGFTIQKKIIRKKDPYLKIMMIQVGIGENQVLSEINKSLSRMAFEDPCHESAQK
ncbi:MAG: hypothetical protein ACQES9_11600 [Myxococcota bacterium]